MQPFQTHSGLVLPFDRVNVDTDQMVPKQFLKLLETYLAEHPEAELLAGATEIGVEINKKARAFPTLISTDGVAELSRVWRDDAGWHVGGAATLTQLGKALGEHPAWIRHHLRRLGVP